MFTQYCRKPKNIWIRRGTIFDREGIAGRIQEIEGAMGEAGFWDNRAVAEQLGRELRSKKYLLETFHRLLDEWNEASGMLELAEADNDTAVIEECARAASRISEEASRFRALLFLNGPHDTSNAIISIHAGAGGKDAQDFAQMLLRMYLRYCERSGFTAKILEESYGEEVGLKSATIEIAGTFAYGMLKAENGVHRLVRLSPFNVKNTRETSFALVEVLPLVETGEVTLDPKDLRIDTYRAGGKGGQSVNTTDSAVRITHIPTNTVVQCQNERSQLQNKESAMKILFARLAELQHEQNVQALSDLKGGRKEISWGNQIRSYVLQPYTLIKDHRTSVSTANVEKVLDGDIDLFIEGYLLHWHLNK